MKKTVKRAAVVYVLIAFFLVHYGFGRQVQIIVRAFCFDPERSLYFPGHAPDQTQHFFRHQFQMQRILATQLPIYCNFLCFSHSFLKTIAAIVDFDHVSFHVPFLLIINAENMP